MSTPAYSLIHLKNGSPAPPAGDQNVEWQQSAPYSTTVEVNNEQLSVTAIDVSAYLPPMIGDTGSGGTGGAVPAPPAGSAAAGKFLKADGTWAVPGGGGGGGGLNGVNEQTGDYTLVSGDNGKLVVLNSAAAHTFTLPNPAPSTTWAAFIACFGGGVLTIARNSLDIDGAAANVTLQPGEGLIVFTDGTNYFTDCNPSTLATQLGVQNESYSYASDTGAANAYAIALAPALASYVAGLSVSFVVGNTNTGASTLNVNSLGAKAIKKFTAGALADLSAGDFTSGDVVTLVYDGTQFQVEGALSQQPYDVAFNPNVVMGSGTIFDLWVAPRKVTFPGNFAGSVGHCRINPGSTQTIAINKNGTQVGTISISSSGVFTFSSTGGTAVTFNSGDYMTLTNQAGADASMLMQCTFAGAR